MVTYIPSCPAKHCQRWYCLLRAMGLMLAALMGLYCNGAQAGPLSAEARIDGLRWQLTALDDAVPVSLNETAVRPEVQSAIAGDTITLWSFGAWVGEGSYPVTARRSFDASTAGAQIVDETLKSSVDVLLTRPAALPGSAWRSDARTSVAMWLTLSPRTVLTVSTHTSGMFDASGLTSDLFHAEVSAMLTWYDDRGQGLASQISLNSDYSFVRSWDETLQLEISNSTLQPMSFRLESATNASVFLPPAAAVPEPNGAMMLLAGLITAALVARYRAHNGAGPAMPRCVRQAHPAGGWCLCASLMLFAAAPAQAQSLDINGRFGPITIEIRAQDGTIRTYNQPWQQLRMIAHVWEGGEQYAGGEIVTTAPAPTALEIARDSGNSWVTFGIAEPAAGALFSANLQPGAIAYASERSMTFTELQATAFLVVPPFSSASATFTAEVDVRPEGMSDTPYEAVLNLSGSSGSPSTWSTSGQLPSRGVLSYTTYFDNTLNSQPSDPYTLMLYGSSHARALVSGIPEASQGMMLGLGLLVLLARRAIRIGTRVGYR
ncbi:hypothetical protein E7V67_008965 [[Empedobacter] haloabium]|uniref:PEP-CTERM sorting domain-containing protein n=1 Tax=[Empedobacter] haloabium TaxID=592317 RepID=A0ABZ1URJ5_9BURK